MDQREEREFAEYFQARREAVRRMAYMMCGDWHMADDHAQTAFVSLHRHWRKIRNKESLDAYVRRTVLRSVIDQSRKPWRREHSVHEVAEGSITTSGSDEKIAVRQTLLDGLRHVPPRQRAVLVLRFLEGLDVASVAEVMRCSEGTVKSQSARGLEALRGALGSALDDLGPTA